MDGAITAFFGGDTTNLEAATKNASIMVKGFSGEASRAVREISEGFVGAVAVMEVIKGIKDIGSAEIEAAVNARQMGEAVSDQQQAWLDLHDGVTSTTGGIRDFAGFALGVFPSMGDAVGSFILDLQGVSPESQRQFTQMANDAEANLAHIAEARKKYLAEEPAERAKVNAELSNLDKQLADYDMSLDDKIAENLDQQAAIKEHMTQMDPQSLAYLKEKAQLEGLELEQLKLQDEQKRQTAAQDANDAKLQLDVSKQYVSQEQQAYSIRKDQQTSEQNIADLMRQQAQWLALSKDASLTESQQAVYAGAAEKASLDLTKEKSQYAKQIALSESDQLAMIAYQSGALNQQNTITRSQYDLLVTQAQQKKVSVDLSQQLAVYDQTGLDSDKQKVIALMQKNEQLTKSIDLQKQEIANDQADAAAIGQQVTAEQAKYNAEVEANAADPFANQPDNPTGGSQVGNVQQFNDPSQELNYLNDSVSNVRTNISSQIADLQSQRNRLENQDFNPTAGSQVTAIDAKIQQLTVALNNVSTANVTSGVAPTNTINSTQAQQQLLTQSNGTLTAISNQLNQILSPPKG